MWILVASVAITMRYRHISKRDRAEPEPTCYEEALEWWQEGREMPDYDPDKE